jgi:hypothetical protein
MADNDRVTSNLKQFFPDKQMFQGTILEDDAKMDQFGVKVRARTTCSLVLASMEANDKKTSEKIALVSDKIQDGALLLLRFGIYTEDSLATYKTKLIIVTGRPIFVCKLAINGIVSFFYKPFKFNWVEMASCQL